MASNEAANNKFLCFISNTFCNQFNSIPTGANAPLPRQNFPACEQILCGGVPGCVIGEGAPSCRYGLPVQTKKRTVTAIATANSDFMKAKIERSPK
jgi:hypothetical protein